MVTPLFAESRVKVSGVSERTPQDVLQLFFENTKRSGGGEISHIDVSDEAAIITFEDSVGMLDFRVLY